MSGIGVDLRPSSCRVIVRETSSVGAVTHHVTDGVRRTIPFAASAEGAWGSAAARIVSGPPVDRQARVLFWRGLRRRLQDHLGGIRPDLRDGYGLTVACEDVHHRTELASELVEAGFVGPKVIGPVEALMACLVQEQPAEFDADIVLAAVFVGETRVEVSAAQFDARRRIVRWWRAPFVEGVGHAIWRDHVRSMLSERYAEQPGAALEAGIDDSILDLARDLSSSSPNGTLWRGVGSGLLFSPIVFNRSEMSNWPGVRRLRLTLQAALTEAGQAFGVSRPAMVAIGGALYAAFRKRDADAKAS